MHPPHGACFLQHGQFPGEGGRWSWQVRMYVSCECASWESGLGGLPQHLPGDVYTVQVHMPTGMPVHPQHRGVEWTHECTQHMHLLLESCRCPGAAQPQCLPSLGPLALCSSFPSILVQEPGLPQSKSSLWHHPNFFLSLWAQRIWTSMSLGPGRSKVLRRQTIFGAMNQTDSALPAGAPRGQR